MAIIFPCSWSKNPAQSRSIFLQIIILAFKWSSAQSYVHFFWFRGPTVTTQATTPWLWQMAQRSRDDSRPKLKRCAKWRLTFIYFLFSFSFWLYGQVDEIRKMKNGAKKNKQHSYPCIFAVHFRIARWSLSPCSKPWSCGVCRDPPNKTKR